MLAHVAMCFRGRLGPLLWVGKATRPDNSGADHAAVWCWVVEVGVVVVVVVAVVQVGCRRYR